MSKSFQIDNRHLSSKCERPRTSVFPDSLALLFLNGVRILNWIQQLNEAADKIYMFYIVHYTIIIKENQRNAQIVYIPFQYLAATCFGYFLPIIRVLVIQSTII